MRKEVRIGDGKRWFVSWSGVGDRKGVSMSNSRSYLLTAGDEELGGEGTDESTEGEKEDEWTEGEGTGESMEGKK